MASGFLGLVLHRLGGTVVDTAQPFGDRPQGVTIGAFVDDPLETACDLVSASLNAASASSQVGYVTTTSWFGQLMIDKGVDDQGVSAREGACRVPGDPPGL